MALSTTQVEASEVKKEKYERPWLEVLKRFSRHRFAVGSVVVLALMILAVTFGPLFMPFGETDSAITKKDQPPGTEYVVPKNLYYNSIGGEIRTPQGTSLTFWLGSDGIGRDLLTRLLYAGRVSLYIAVAVTFISEIIGIIIGVMSGYFGGIVDAFAMRFVDFLNTLPLLPILLIISTILEPTINLLILILVFFSWTGGARLMRGQILSLREQEYVSASRALGASNLRIMFRHLVPNALAPNIVNASLALSGVMITEAALSFLGFGVKLPAASWGNMLKGVNTTILEKYTWQAFFPGLAIFICSLCFNFIGDGLRDALDPRAKR